MNSIFKTLFSPSKTKKSFGQSSLMHSKTDLASVQDGSENAVRQQLIQTLHRDLMRKCGIPLEWIACHTQVMVSRTKGTGMSVVLVVKHWDERLMNHTFALQRALAAEVVEFEPAAEQWLHGIAWRLDVASSCPHIDLPEKSYWNDQYTPAQTAAAVQSQKAELAALKIDLTARNAELAEGRVQLAFSQGDVEAKTAQLAAQSIQLEESKRELASSRTERAALLAGGQRPVQRTEFMPHKSGAFAAFTASTAASAAASTALPPIAAPDDTQAKLDLDRLFAIRDTALQNTPAPAAKFAGQESPASTGYEPTQPSPLRS